MDEIEILRGAKVRVTTQMISVGAKTTQVADIKSAAFIDARISGCLPERAFVD